MNHNRYLRITEWARKRYTVGDALIVSVGGIPSPYTRIERAAWGRLMMDCEWIEAGRD